MKDGQILTATRNSWFDEWEVNGVKVGYGDMRDVSAKAARHAEMGIALIKVGITLIKKAVGRS